MDFLPSPPGGGIRIKLVTRHACRSCSTSHANTTSRRTKRLTVAGWRWQHRRSERERKGAQRTR